MYEYMEMPQELKSVAEAFVKHGEANGGEDGFVIEELSELIRSICRIQRYGETLGGTNMPKYNLTEEIAHVYLVLNHLRVKYDIPIGDIQFLMNLKIESWEKALKEAME